MVYRGQNALELCQTIREVEWVREVITVLHARYHTVLLDIALRSTPLRVASVAKVKPWRNKEPGVFSPPPGHHFQK